MNGSILISLLFILTYVLTYLWTYGVPDSISQTFFGIKHRWVFSVVIAVSFVLLLSPLMEALAEEWQWLGFLTAAGGLLIAFAPNLDDKMEENVHMTGAIIMGVASQLIVAVLNPWMLTVWMLWIPFARGKNRVFWSEMIGGGALYGAIIL